MTATGSVDEIIAAKPDVLTFHGVFPDEDLYVKVLEAGINIVTTADWITGHHRNQNHPHPSGKPTTELLERGVLEGRFDVLRHRHEPRAVPDPGRGQLRPTSPRSRTSRSSSRWTYPATIRWTPGRMCGYGLPVDDPRIPGMLEVGTRVFADGVYLMADCFGLELDDVTFSYELGACTEDVDLGWYQLPKGSLGANYLKYQGIVDGVPNVEVHLEWQMTRHTEPRWKVQHCYITKIQGDPCITSKHMMHPKPGVDIYSPGRGRLDRHDDHRHARPQRDLLGRRGAARATHQRRHPVARIRRAIQDLNHNPPLDPHHHERPDRMNAPVRVFQVATGNVGSEMIKRIGNRTDLELIGLHCYSPEKIGRDAGEIVGLPPIGVKATGTDRGDHRRQARRAHLPRRLPRRGPLRESP